MQFNQTLRLGTRTINAISNASGYWSATIPQMRDLVNKHHLKTIVAKTCSLKPRVGNPLPNYIKFPTRNVALNCMGMPNNGYLFYRNMLPYFNQQNINFIISLDASDVDELRIMLEDYNLFVANNSSNTEVVELNLSCPNIHGGSRLPSYDLATLENILQTISNGDYQYLNIGCKLSPYLDNYLLKDVATLLNTYGVDNSVISHIILSNTIPNAMLIDTSGKIVLSNKVGGISGFPAQLLALSNIYHIRKWLHKDIAIIGCGGIKNEDDIQKYKSVGAVGFQLASQFF